MAGLMIGHSDFLLNEALSNSLSPSDDSLNGLFKVQVIDRILASSDCNNGRFIEDVF